MRKLQFVRRRIAPGTIWFGMLAALLFSTPLAVRATTLLSQSYKADKSLAVGSIVSINADSTSVVAANITNVDSIFGVVVGANDVLLSLTGAGKNQVKVATNGLVQVLVSDIGGDIKSGDQITASPVDGVGMKATTNVKVVGVAQENLASSQGKSTQTVTDKNGKKQQVQLGSIPVLVNVAYYFKTPEKTIIPTAIQNVANSIANKTVSPLPIIISLVIFIVAMISIVSLIYAAIRSSIISVGRNPLSQAAVYRSLMQVTVLVLTILAGSVAAIYLMLVRL